MSDQRLRTSLFHLAVAIDVEANVVTYADWTEGLRPTPVQLSLDENAALNLFLRPRTVDEAAACAGLTTDDLATRLSRARSLGLLVTEDTWEERRREMPYGAHASIWLDRPSEPRQYSGYEEAYAHNDVPWNQLPIAWEVIALGPRAGGGARLLDVGCGSGHNLHAMEALGFTCSGIDISPTAVARLQETSSTPERFVVGSVSKLPWEDGAFDVVTDIGCLHCLRPEEADIAAYVHEIRRVLAPGGRFVCRAFKPRQPEIVDAQPVAMERLGYDPDEIQAFFDGVLDVNLVKEGRVHGIYLAERD